MVASCDDSWTSDPPFSRIVATASRLNESDWWAFYAGSFTVNSLSKPRYRTGITPAPRLLWPLLQLQIGGRWVLEAGSCALQDCDALLISFWPTLCVCASTYAYPPEVGVQDWLQYHCNLSIRRVQAKLSSRRSIASAMLYLNPDAKSAALLPSWQAPMIIKS
jgi:hypothetical protein